jgi:uncharacterized UBP type Zn finger protein
MQMPELENCAHAQEIGEVVPSSPDTCQRCVEMGDTWVHLRICAICGNVACCDQSKNRHARRHFHEAGHPIIQSYEPGENWRYCFIDDIELPPGKVYRR